MKVLICKLHSVNHCFRRRLPIVIGLEFLFLTVFVGIKFIEQTDFSFFGFDHSSFPH